MIVDTEDAVTCPKCGHRDVADCFDVLGACNDNVFCTQCHCEFDPDSGKIHQCGKDAMKAASDRERGVKCRSKRRK